MRPVENWYFDLPAFARLPARPRAPRLEADSGRAPHRATGRQASSWRRPSSTSRTRPKRPTGPWPTSCLRTASARPRKASRSFEIEFDAIDDRDEARRRADGGGHPVPHQQDARAVPHHGQHRMGREGPGHRRRGGPHRVVLAGKPVGAHLVHHGGERRVGAAAHELARLLVLARRPGLPVHRPGQPVLLRRRAAGAHRGPAPGRHPRARRDGPPAAADDARRQPPPAVRRQEGVVVGRGRSRPRPTSFWTTTPPSSCVRTSWRWAWTSGRWASSPSRTTRTRRSATTRAWPTPCSRKARCSRTCSTAWPAAASTRQARTSTGTCPSALPRPRWWSARTRRCAPTTRPCTAWSCMRSCRSWTTSSGSRTSTGPKASVRPSWPTTRWHAARCWWTRSICCGWPRCSCIPSCPSAPRRSATT